MGMTNNFSGMRVKGNDNRFPPYFLSFRFELAKDMFMPAVHAIKSANGNYSIIKNRKLRYVMMYLQGKW